MNSTTLSEAKLGSDVETRTTHFRQKIARYCANILYGNHTRKTDLIVDIPTVIACIPFSSEGDRNTLASDTHTHFADLIYVDPDTISVTATIIARKSCITGEQEDYVRIEVRPNNL